MADKLFLIEQLDQKIQGFSKMSFGAMPTIGWLKTIRTYLGMSMQQLRNKLSISKQGVWEIEKIEKEGSITVKSLAEIANTMDMKLVYGFCVH